MDSQEIIQAEADYVLQTYVRPEIVFTHGEGSHLFDADGNKYLDFMSGIAVMALGHSDKEWITAVTQQAAQLTHISNLYHSAPQVKLAKQLVESSFADKVYFCNSGTEANEAAMKFARKFSKTHSETRKTKIVAFSGSFHGRTMGSLAVTYKENYRAPFEPLMPDVAFAEFNNLESAAATIDDQTCAVIVEPVQGEGGVQPATAQFLQQLRDLCDQHGALLIFDEVQCGLGRTGTLWAHEAVGVIPDMMTLAKPLAGGLPIGATLVTQAVADVIKPGDHASTFAAGPLVCAAANVIVNRVNQPQFLQQVQQNGAYLHHRLQTLESEQILEVRSAGLLVGVQMKTAPAPSRGQAVSSIITAARNMGLLIINSGENILRLAPPLNVSREEIDTAVNVIEECLG